MSSFILRIACLVSMASGAAAQRPVASAPGVIHFEDGARLPFRDVLKIRVGPQLGIVLLEPRGIYLQREDSNVLIPASELREIALLDYRVAPKTQCRTSCGIHAARLAVRTTAGLSAIVKVGFADSLIVSVDDEAGGTDVRAVPWAVVRRDTVRLNIRRIVFSNP